MESFELVVLALEVAAWRVSGAEQEYSLSKAIVIHVECGHQMNGWPLCARPVSYTHLRAHETA